MAQPITQLEQARAGTITPEMEYVASARASRRRGNSGGGRGRSDGDSGQPSPSWKPIWNRWASALPRRARSTPTSATRRSPAIWKANWKSCTRPSTSVPTRSWICRPARNIDRSARRSSPGLAGTDRHRADLPDAGRTGRRNRRHAAAAFSRHGRAPGQAGRRLHDDPLRRDAASICT